MDEEDDLELLEQLHIEKNTLLTGRWLLGVHFKKLNTELMKWQEKVFDSKDNIPLVNELIEQIMQTTAKVHEINKKLDPPPPPPPTMCTDL